MKIIGDIQDFSRMGGIAALLIAGGSLVSRGDNASAIRQSLAANDAKVAQGSISDLCLWGYGPALRSEPKNKSRVAPMLSQPFTVTQALKYDRGGRFIYNSSLTSPGRIHVKNWELWDGQSDVAVVHTGDSAPDDATVTSNQPKGPMGGNARSGLAPGPTFIMGRGLSKISNSLLTKNGQTVSLQWPNQDGSTYYVLLDPSHDYLARSIVCKRRDGQTESDWELRYPRLSRQGIWYPTQAICSIYERGQLLIKAEYRGIKADFAPPNKLDFVLPLRAGTMVYDKRLGAAVQSRQGRSGVLPTNTLLQKTRVKLEQQAEDTARMRAALLRIRIEHLALMLGPTLIACAMAAAYCMRTKLGRSAA